MNFPSLIQNGVISAHTDVCIACGATADMWNVLGAFCQSHKPNYVREFKTKEDLKYLDVTQDPALREHLKAYVSEVWKL